MSTVLILLDAFRHDYLDESTTPFLWRCAKEGEHYERVQPSLGFCERTEILTGLKGSESGFFSAIGFDPLNSPYAGAQGLSALDVIEKLVLWLLRLGPPRFGNKVQKRLRAYVKKYLQRADIKMPSYLIPYPWLPYFALTEDRVDLRLADAFPRASIFELLEKAGKTYFYDSFTALGFSTPYASENERIDAVVRDLSSDKKDLYLVYISIPDAQGHRLGPESVEFRKTLREMDEMLEGFVVRAERVAPGNRFLFVGDHGMLTVNQRCDAGKEIDSILLASGLEKEKDVLYFLDSTMVRLWARSDEALEKLPGLLRKSSELACNGKWMDVETARRFHVPWPDKRYGDYLWVANPGVLVFPDFFHRAEPCVGMHGYDPSLPASQGVCIHWGDDVAPQNIPAIQLSDVFDVLRRSVGV